MAGGVNPVARFPNLRCITKNSGAIRVMTRSRTLLLSALHATPEYITARPQASSGWHSAWRLFLLATTSAARRTSPPFGYLSCLYFRSTTGLVGGTSRDLPGVSILNWRWTVCTESLIRGGSDSETACIGPANLHGAAGLTPPAIATHGCAGADFRTTMGLAQGRLFSASLITLCVCCRGEMHIREWGG
jgi:hypothetical protein